MPLLYLSCLLNGIYISAGAEPALAVQFPEAVGKNRAAQASRGALVRRRDQNSGYLAWVDSALSSCAGPAVRDRIMAADCRTAGASGAAAMRAAAPRLTGKDRSSRSRRRPRMTQTSLCLPHPIPRLPQPNGELYLHFACRLVRHGVVNLVELRH